jgi:hypothetical protein
MIFFSLFDRALDKECLIASNLDPCLFMSKTLIMIIYVDDILIYGRSTDDIDNLIKRLKKDDIALNNKGIAEGYLGVDIQQDRDKISLLQEGLTKWIITALGLDSKYSTPMNTPAEMAALGCDIDGNKASGCINYASIVSMLLYLGHSQPNISFATHQCACYTHAPKQSHKDALKQIGRYLKGTLNNELVLTPSNDFKIDCYPDADFAGLWL